MPGLTLEFDVYCSECGAGLCETVKEDDRRQDKSISLPPCKDCMEKARKEARQEGWDSGYEEGFDDGCQEAPEEKVAS